MTDGWYRIERVFPKVPVVVEFVYQNWSHSGGVSSLKSQGATYEAVLVMTNEEFERAVAKALQNTVS